MSELIGKRVRLISLEPLLEGVTGVLKAYNDERDVYAFEADEEGVLFHSCAGLTLSNRGRWVGFGDYELIEDEPNEFCGYYTCEDLSASPVANEPIAEQTTCKSEDPQDLIGKRVRLKAKSDHVGLTGVLKKYDSHDSSYAFEADESNPALHDCGGNTAYDRGWWVWEDEFEIIEYEPTDNPATMEESKPSPYFDEHYASSAIQPIIFMMENFTPEEMVGFLKGNIIKYTARCGKKDDPAKEVAKIKRYAEWLKEYQTTGTITI